VIFTIPAKTILRVLEVLEYGHPDYEHCEYKSEAFLWCSVCSYRDCPNSDLRHYSKTITCSCKVSLQAINAL
jgi:hypothetical protein